MIVQFDKLMQNYKDFVPITIPKNINLHTCFSGPRNKYLFVCLSGGLLWRAKQTFILVSKKRKKVRISKLVCV